MAFGRLALGSRVPNRRLIFTVGALAVLNAKVVHIYTHISAVPAHELRLWSYSFFAQDVTLLILIRLLFDHWVSGLANTPRCVVTLVTGLLVFYNTFISLVAVSFYIVAGAEIRWRNAAIATDAESWAVISSGTVSFIVVVCLTLTVSWLLQNIYYGLFGYAADLVNWPFALLWRTIRRTDPSQNRYAELAQRDAEQAIKPGFENDDAPEFEASSFAKGTTEQAAPEAIRRLQRLFQKLGIQISRRILMSGFNVLAYVTVGIALLALVLLTLARPNDGSLAFLQWTAALLPFVDFSSSSPNLEKLPTRFGTGIQRSWDNRTAVVDQTPFTWLPEGVELDGFGDWYTGREHYVAAADPMRISNLEEPVLPLLRKKLKEVPIRHVVLILLESTRHDIFPIKKDGLIWQRLAETFPDGELPQEVRDKLDTLTPTANYITGDYDDGFEHDEENMPRRGGIHFTNTHTAGTYTLKSMVGTICGVSPLIADFNLDYKHHIYQPCLPHIFEALNRLNSDGGDMSEKWHTYFYMASTLHYDNQDKLMASLGFAQENIIDQEYLRSPDARHGTVTLPNINAFATEEDPLEDYFRDVFASAKKENERVFLTHLTTTSHHAFRMPESEKYTPVANGLDFLSHYVNAEGYDDKWVSKILNVLDDEGVANETLVVFLGDHGLSMPENDIVSPYYNPSIGIDHVPLVISHPKMPSFEIHDAVHSTQVLPTILDLLLETGSLGGTSSQAASDLLHNYEGQSLIRPVQNTNRVTGQGNWQFTLVNPGRAVLTVRDARYPERHLVVPVIGNVEWRLSNITADPREQYSVQSFDFTSFLKSVEQRHGVNVAEWVEEGAFMSRWWVEENAKRWRYGPYDK